MRVFGIVRLSLARSLSEHQKRATDVRFCYDHPLRSTKREGRSDATAQLFSVLDASATSMRRTVYHKRIGHASTHGIKSVLIRIALKICNN